MPIPTRDSLNTRRRFAGDDMAFDYFSLTVAESAGLGPASRLPVCLKILIENLLRHEDGENVALEHARALANWPCDPKPGLELAFYPMRILMPDSSGIPLLADLAAMRDAIGTLGGSPGAVNPTIPLDLVVDHSVVVDVAGRTDAYRRNLDNEYERNAERYAFLRWAQQAFRRLTVVPPGNGICHQVNLEALARVVCTTQDGDRRIAYPETLVGMDSHTPMVNSLGVLGWGVGGIEAATAMLGQPIGVRIPEIVGCRLVGKLRPGVTTTDLVLTVTERLRARKVVGAFVEFCGAGIDALTLPERATLSNMAPEYGATTALFPVDAETLSFLALSGRPAKHVRLVGAYAKVQGLWRDGAAPEPVFSHVVEIDLAAVEPSAAGPRRPQDRISLGDVPRSFRESFADRKGGAPLPSPGRAGRRLADGDVVIAAITSCTNTSNPSVMVAAGLLARNAARRGLRPKPWVKTSLAPGSRVVSHHLETSGLQTHLDALGFNLVGYGCTTCMGNSGPLDPDIAREIEERDVVATAVLSGNRNFESRIHPLVRANYLVAPPLVVAYAIAGTVLVDFAHDPLGEDAEGRAVRLADLWPDDDEIRTVIRRHVTKSAFAACHHGGVAGAEDWDALPMTGGESFGWNQTSTYLCRPPFFDAMTRDAEPIGEIIGARPLAILGDSITTDHISPVGAIPEDSPAGRYLIGCGVAPKDFSSYMARRVNHEVMIRGTFANLLLRNEMVPQRFGGLTRHMPDGAEMTIYDAACLYAKEGVPLVVVAGAEYGAGSSRDWAAKGTRLLGIRAVIAESFERIHRSNLIGMGVLPLELPAGTTRRTLGLDGRELFDLHGLAAGLRPRMTLSCTVRRPDGPERRIDLLARIDTEREAAWYRNGGVLRYALRGVLEH